MQIETILTAAHVDKLTAAVKGKPVGRVATKEKSIERFARALEARIGEHRVARDLRPILSASGLETAEGELAAALDHADAEDEASLAAEAEAPAQDAPAPANSRPAPDVDLSELAKAAAEADAEEAAAEEADALAAIIQRGKAKAEQADEKAEKPARAPKKLGKRAAVLEAAKGGELPPKPDFSAPTHERFRGKLDEVHAAAIAGDLSTLRAFEIKTTSSSPKAIAKYRDLCVIAIEARAAGKQEA